LGLNRSMAVEREGGFEAVFNAPIPRVAIFWGKCLANLAFTLCVAALMLPIMVVLYNMESLISGWLILALVLGMFGFTAVGTLLATITVQTRARDSLLPILLLPLGLPILLAAVRLTIHILTGAPPEQYTTWLGVLLAVDVVYVLLCVVLFPYLNED
jgi:heme exporter protein B